MNGKQAIRAMLQSTQRLLTGYLEDLSDQDLYVRPVTGANHIAWQIGHLIASESGILAENLPGATYPQLPEGFAQRHGKEGTGQDSTEGLLKREQYVQLFNATRAATLAALEGLSDADLDRPGKGRMARMAPTLGDMLILACNHTMMHGGQFSTVRRKLGKPVIF